MADDRVPTLPQLPGRRVTKPEQVGDWILDRRLGGGGFGEVYAAHHHSTQQPVAIKLLHEHYAASGEMRARFEREIEVLSRLAHPNIARMIEAGFDADGRPFSCMELLDGRDLDDVIKDQRLSPEAVRKIFEPLCDAIGHAHALGIVHRDIKASNVFVCEPGGRIVLLDFGIAKLADALELTGSQQLLGTHGCMAPEQINGGRVDARTDIYGLGVLLFHMLAGRLPFNDPSETMTQYLHLHARRPRVSAVAPVPTELDDVVARAMAVEPSERFADPRALYAALRAALRESVRPAPVTAEHFAILVAVDDLSGGDALDEALIADLEAVLPAAERTLSQAGFTLAIEFGTSGVFVAPATVDGVAAALATWDELIARPTLDKRVRVAIGVHRGTATVVGDRVGPSALLRPETWGVPEPLEGVWVTDAIEPAARRIR